MNINIPKHVDVTDNGLIFYSNHVLRCGIYTYIEGKEVKTERICHPIEQTHNKLKEVIKILIAIALFILPFVIESIYNKNLLNIKLFTIVFLNSCYNNLLILSKDFFHSHISKKGRKKQQFHATKHIILNSCKELGGIPNLWELENANKYYYDCDMYSRICKTFHGLLISIAFCFYEYPFNIMQFFSFYIVAYIIVTIISRILHKLDLFVRLEWLFLADPNDIQLQAAIEGLEQWLESEKIFK